jgi:putative endonuclease
MAFCYVYILQTTSGPEHYYVGLTDDLQARLRKQNAGEVPHSRKFTPWKIKTAIAFTDREQASRFERYLKTSSGRAFAKKRL